MHGLSLRFAKMKATQSLALDEKQVNVFEPLTPVVMTDEQSARYMNELRNALASDQVRNIAITGDYGAGKSSLIRTFVAKHPDLTYAWVSLATFGKDGVVDSPSTASTHQAPGVQASPSPEGNASPSPSEVRAEAKLVERIEETIVQQLLYSVRAVDLPKTRLKRIVQASTSSIVVMTVFLAGMVIAGLRMYAENLVDIWLIEPSWLVDQVLRIPDWLAVAMIFIGVLYLIYRFTVLFSAFNIDGLTVRGGKLEATNHGSVLHKHIDELIYFFERSDIDVVFIEDLDRFGIQDVFFRLREINLIIKNSPEIKRPIFFIYALRDELFVSNEKTKFFDLVIPVIPVVNFENSEQKLVELLSQRHLKGESLFSYLNPVLVETVSYYIDDMRLLINIVNEFDIYANTLAKDINLDMNKLFSVAFIRNLYPREYAGLLRRSGTLHEFFEVFETWKQGELLEVDKKIENARSELELRKEGVARNVKELRQQLWFDLLQLAGAEYASHFELNRGDAFAITQFLEDEVFELLEQSDGSLAVGTANYGFQIRGQRVAVNKLLSSGSPPYTARAKRLAVALASFSGEVSKLSEQKDRLKKWNLKDALKHDGFNEVVVSHFSSMRAMAYLVRAGFFGNDFATYIGYFYAGALSRDDMNIILDFRAGRSPSVISPLAEPKLILSKLSHGDLGNGRGILVDLIKYLCGAGHARGLSKEKDSTLEAVLKGSLPYSDRISEVLTALMDSEFLERFVRAIYHYEPVLFHYVLVKNERFIGSESRQKLIVAIISSLSEDELEDMEIETAHNFFPIVEELDDVTLLIPLFEKGEGGWARFTTSPLEFSKLTDSNSAQALRSLLKLGCLKLNLPTLRLIYATFSPAPLADKDTISYHSLNELALGGFDGLVARNPGYFISELLSQNGKLGETPETLVWLLKQISDDDDLMFSLIEWTDAIFESLEGIPPVLWPNILESSSVIASREVIFAYFVRIYYAEDGQYLAFSPETALTRYTEQNAAFISFISRNAELLRPLLWEGFDRFENDLQATLLADRTITETALVTLLSETVLEQISVLSQPLTVSRWATLVTMKYLPYDYKVLEVITAKAPAQLATYLTKRWEAAAEDFDPAAANLETLIGVTRSDAVPIREKVGLWSAISIEVIKSHQESRSEIARICELGNPVGSVFQSVTCLPMLWEVSVDLAVPAKQRIEAFLQIIGASSIDWSQTAIVLDSLDEEGFQRLAKKDRRFTVAASDVNLRLIRALREKGFVGKDSETKGRVTVTAMTSALQ
jgi:hypothetical protein